MSPSRQITVQRAVVLHRRPYRNTSALVEIFSEAHGRVGLVARGIQRGKAPLRGVLQPFVPLLLSWRSGGELGTLTAAEAAGRAPQLQGTRLFSGFYVNELVMRLLHRHDPHPGLFAVYLDTLLRLAHEQDEEPALRAFELCLLDELGYGLVLEHDVMSGEAIVAGRVYRYVVEQGPMLEKTAEDAGIRVQGDTLLALAAAREFGAASRVEAKRLMRALLAHYLGGRPLRARDYFSTNRQAPKP